MHSINHILLEINDYVEFYWYELARHRIRILNKISEQTLANYIGLEMKDYSSIENGSRSPTFDQAALLSQFSKKSYGFFFIVDIQALQTDTHIKFTEHNIQKYFFHRLSYLLLGKGNLNERNIENTKDFR